MQNTKGETKEIGKIYITRLLDKGYRLTVEWDRGEGLSLPIVTLFKDYYDKGATYTSDKVILEKIL